MHYLLSELLVCLIIAAIIGGIIGWLIHKIFWCQGKGHIDGGELELSNRKILQLKVENERTLSLLAEARKPKAIDIKGLEVEEIEGIGKGYGKRLREMGIAKVEDILQHGLSSEGRANIATKTQLSAIAINAWVSVADLMRIPGVGKQFSELLEASGVKSVEQLRHQNAGSLADKMKSVNETQRITTDQLPKVAEVEQWISLSKDMELRLKV